ncbi:hypothetical protein P154DRAFT_271410 [Amniculicola lignicola CBS 123094]|uniref:Uncharacterized protein n=1 Tax=Amniculicola lignicola CBS 123094 TaxID=1392246 RepID=A0A6A5WAP0_9PLEO|nr:hypothetical protein P154DRAFT_271410 [Amniculicola lignicola CBS 123094]
MHAHDFFSARPRNHHRSTWWLGLPCYDVAERPFGFSVCFFSFVRLMEKLCALFLRVATPALPCWLWTAEERVAERRPAPVMAVVSAASADVWRTWTSQAFNKIMVGTGEHGQKEEWDGILLCES